MSSVTHYEPHPIADIFPMMIGAEFEGLKADISARGLLTPIVLHEGMILDGRNRAMACEELNVPLRLIEYIGSDPIGDVISWNLHRRHLDASQRGMVAARLADMPQSPGINQHDRSAQICADRTSQAEAAERMNVGRGTLQNCKKVLNDGCQELVASVDAGIFPASVAAKVADMPKAQQAAVVDKVMSGEKPKHAVVAVKKEVIAEVSAEPGATVDAPTSSVSCVLGQWYSVGDHRLYCGSSTDDAFRQAAIDSGAALAFADPPYNAGVADWDEGFEWDHDWLIDVAPIVVVTPGIASIASFMRRTQMPYRWSVAGRITNGKARGPLGFGNWIFGAVFSRLDSIDRKTQDAWEFPITGETTGHKGQKPLGFMAHLIQRLSATGDVIVDPFAGSGTTAVAGHRLGRKTLCAELNADFCAAIVARLEREVGCERVEQTGVDAPTVTS